MKKTEEKQHGEFYYLELKDKISIKLKMNDHQREFVRYYLGKLGVDVDEDPLITISPMDSLILAALVLDIITEYETYYKTDSKQIASRA